MMAARSLVVVWFAIRVFGLLAYVKNDRGKRGRRPHRIQVDAPERMGTAVRTESDV